MVEKERARAKSTIIILTIQLDKCAIPGNTDNHPCLKAWGICIRLVSFGLLPSMEISIGLSEGAAWTLVGIFPYLHPVCDLI